MKKQCKHYRQTDGFAYGAVILGKNLTITWGCSKDSGYRQEVSRIQHPLIGLMTQCNQDRWYLEVSSPGHRAKVFRV